MVQIDGAPALQSLVHDPILKRQSLSLGIGRFKNINRNPVGERALQELETEVKKQYPSSRPVAPYELAVAVASLNSRIRERGFAAREILFPERSCHRRKV